MNFVAVLLGPIPRSADDVLFIELIGDSIDELTNAEVRILAPRFELRQRAYAYARSVAETFSLEVLPDGSVGFLRGRRRFVCPIRIQL